MNDGSSSNDLPSAVAVIWLIFTTNRLENPQSSGGFDRFDVCQRNRQTQLAIGFCELIEVGFELREDGSLISRFDDLPPGVEKSAHDQPMAEKRAAVGKTHCNRCRERSRRRETGVAQVAGGLIDGGAMIDVFG